jgi:hypothetical protein
MATQVHSRRRQELFDGLHAYICERGGFVISVPSLSPLRFECSPDSTLPIFAGEHGKLHHARWNKLSNGRPRLRADACLCHQPSEGLMLWTTTI